MTRSLPPRRARFVLMLWMGLIGLALLSMFSIWLQQDHLVTHKIHYELPEAGEVFILWGINGWQSIPESSRPQGTVLKDGFLFSPMQYEGNTFVVTMQVPEGATIDYVFLVTQANDGRAIGVWDSNSDQDYHTLATQEGVTSVQPDPDFGQLITSAAALEISAPVTQEIRYHQAEAGEVFLVWGINGWGLVPEASRSPETVVKEEIMHTPMLLSEGTFVATVQVPHGATLDYGFLITRKSTGTPIRAVWDGESPYRLTATHDDVIDIVGQVKLAQAREIANGILDVGLNLLIAAGVALAVALMLTRIPPENIDKWVWVGLYSLIVVGLALRVWAAWSTNQRLPDTPERLTGDEVGYDYLGYSLLQGTFFDWPARTPVYPLFLAGIYGLFGHSYGAVLYVQAFVSTTVIPLTYLLAKRFGGKRAALLAASIVAFHAELILQVNILYSEVLYTPLLLLSVISLLWALEAPRMGRFVVAGAMLAIATLCRPLSAFLPVILPLVLPHTWSLGRRVGLGLAYVGALVILIGPWTFHNYQTYGIFLPLSTGSSAVLWQGSPDYYHLMEQKRTLAEIASQQLDPEWNGGHDPFSIEGDRYFAARAIASIRAEPKVYAKFVLQKLAYFWFGHPTSEWPDYKPFNLNALMLNYPAWQVVGLYFTRLLPFVALAALVVLRRYLRRFISLLAVCLYFMLLHAFTHSLIRYSVPLHPLLATLIAAAVGLVWTRIYASLPEFLKARRAAVTINSVAS